MIKKILIIITFIFTTVGLCNAFTIVEDGKAKSVIIIPQNPTKVVKYAAEELQYHVTKATGASLNIIKENEQMPENINKIYVGPTKASLDTGIDTTKMEPQEFIIKATERALFLVGRDSSGDVLLDPHAPSIYMHRNMTHVGTLFAVYDFLENNLGVKWLWPGELGTVVPRKTNIDIPIVVIKRSTNLLSPL